jgi:hypothetical protein
LYEALTTNLAVMMSTALFGSALLAGDSQTKTTDRSSDPYQSEGFWVKTMLEFDDANDRPVYQEIIPCRLIDTRPSSAFEAPFGGPTFSPGETRTYVLDQLPATNPCQIGNRRSSNPAYDDFEDGMIALSVRVTWYNRSGDSGGTPAAGIVQVGDTKDLPMHGAIAAWFGWGGVDFAESQQGLVRGWPTRRSRTDAVPRHGDKPANASEPDVRRTAE